MADDKEKSQWDRIQELFNQRFGDDWHKDITLNLRANQLAWFVHLIEQGIEKRRLDAIANKQMDMSMVASLGSWHLDLEALVNKVEFAITPNSARRAKEKK